MVVGFVKNKEIEKIKKIKEKSGEELASDSCVRFLRERERERAPLRARCSCSCEKCDEIFFM